MASPQSAKRIKRVLFVLGAGLAFAGFAGAAAEEARQHARTAAQHAEYATDAGSVPAAHHHLQHAINCLVGPEGDGYSAEAGDPCNGEGEGIIGAIGDGDRAAAEQALQEAQAGLQTENLAEAQEAAVKTHRTLLNLQH
jgi:hypothetical protein